MATTITCDVQAKYDTQYYGTLTVSNIRNSDNTAVKISSFLGLTFKSPAAVDKTAFNVSLTPWQEVKAMVESEQINSSLYSVSAGLHVKSPHTFNTGDTITIGINGDLGHDTETYVKSFVLAVDKIPDTSGKVDIHCEAAPHPMLANSQQEVTLTEGNRVVSAHVLPGKNEVVSAKAGNYAVAARELATADETYVATAHATPASLVVEAGKTALVSVTYSNVRAYSALDIAIGNLPGLENDQLLVAVDAGNGSKLATFSSPINHTTSLRRLPSTGTAAINVGTITLNNVEYSFPTRSQPLSPSLLTVSFSEQDAQKKKVEEAGFVQLPIVMDSAVTLDRTILVRLSSATLGYTQTVKAAPGTTSFACNVGPGKYTVHTASFVQDGVVYFVDADETLTVASNGTTKLHVHLKKGPGLHVRGIPDFLSFGGCANLTPTNLDDFVAARASSVFKYAGIDGAGDGGVYLPDDTQTKATIQLARSIETKLADGNPVLPVMVSYTCNLSLGHTTGQLQNKEQLARSFANFILALKVAKEAKDEKHPVPAGFVVNPDFLGACQQEGLAPSYRMPVTEPLQTALDHHNVPDKIPAAITDDLRSYVRAVNWLVRAVAPEVTYGWQVNLWGVGHSRWLYSTGDAAEDPAQLAKQTADYVLSLGVYEPVPSPVKLNLRTMRSVTLADFEAATYLPAPPDFIAVDRYEADDFTLRAYHNSYCYGPHEWRRFFAFCRALSAHLAAPVMPWQIPASRIPLTTEVVSDLEKEHWGTAGSWILGHSEVGSDYHTVNQNILNLELPPVHQPFMGKNPRDMFIRGEPFDFSRPAYEDFPVRGIFTVLLGGGATTGIVSDVGNPESWVRNKLNKYMERPINLQTAKVG
ncbi:putative hydroxymethyltransferase [Chaetomium strumarium]|uniref:Hydroxymethyltransferase n=1 Tax=Chaetomium strumarium TaxID=1170767 RepID=A0AAJ0GXB7_9PEZI|nr:putative hydroxymethyltransferase [Chaetomium strumarium]